MLGKLGTMLTFADKYKYNVFSQNGEDGILAEIIRRINPKEKTAVEFGCPSFEYCSNTALLAKNGWDVYMYDKDLNEDTRIQRVEITPDNVNGWFGRPTLLSIDIDNDDFHVWKAYEEEPDIVVIEINSSYPAMSYEIPGEHGASYRAMVTLGINKGYFLVVHTGNLIFVRLQFAALFPEIIKHHPLAEWELFFNKSFL